MHGCRRVLKNGSDFSIAHTGAPPEIRLKEKSCLEVYDHICMRYYAPNGTEALRAVSPPPTPSPCDLQSPKDEKMKILLNKGPREERAAFCRGLL